MWTYSQSAGELQHNGDEIGIGYSGYGAHMNDPASQGIPDAGPLPQGLYTIGPPHDTLTHGPFVMALTPDDDNQMFGRSGFLIHGDSTEHPGFASHGCIILKRWIRDLIAASGDNRLEVVE